MELTRKRIIIMFSVIAGVLVVGAVVGWLLLSRAEPSPTNTQNTNTEVPLVNATTNTSAAAANTNTPTDEEVELARMANFFTERYGSYSSQADYQNIIDLKPYMTTRMQTTSDDFVKLQRAQGAQTTFSSIVTKVLSTTIVSFSGAEATVRLSTQREESGPTTSSYYQDILLDLAKEGDQWLVNRAVWQTPGITAPAAANTNAANVNGRDAITNSVLGS